MSAGFYIYETKPFCIRLKPPGTLSMAAEARSIIVTIYQAESGITMEKQGNEITIEPEEDKLFFYMTQEETAKFKPGSAMVQVNILYEDAERDTSAQGMIRIYDNLHKEVMT